MAADRRPDRTAPHDALVQRRMVLEAPPERVWRALTDARELDAWWGAGTEIDARPGGAGRFVDPDGTVREGMVVQAEPGRRLRLDWWPVDEADDDDRGGDDPPATRVTIDLRPCPFGTVVTVTEAALADLVVHPPVLLPMPPSPRRWSPGPRALVLAGR